MRKFVAVLSAVALIGFASQASAQGMYAGIKGGVNFGNVGGDDAPDDTSMRTGFQGGLFIGKDVSEAFGFRAEALWVQKGAKADEDFGPGIGVVEVTYKADYVDIPVFFVYHLPAGESVTIDLFAGPSFNFNISAEAEADGGESEDIDNVESFEFGAAIGAGIAKKMASGKSIGLDVRYSLGATSIFSEVDLPGGGTADVDVKNSGIGLMAFFQVPLGSSGQ